MSATERRHGERRQEDRRQDQRAHVLEQGIVSAGIAFVTAHDAEDHAERIAAHRRLRELVRAYLSVSEGGMAAVDVMLTAAVVALVLLPSALVGPGMGRWLLAVAGLAACATMLWRGERS